jgi:hypothetical protein
LQSWSQDRLSSIAFRIPKTRAFEAEVNQYSDDIKRQADVYVFAVLTTKVQEDLDPMDLSQWEFYVVPVSLLNQRTRSQAEITLPSVKQLAGDPIPFDALRKAVESLGTKERNQNTDRVHCEPLSFSELV